MKVSLIPVLGLAASIACFSLQANAVVPNFAKVDARVFRGGRPTTEQDIEKLKKLGIKTIINLQGGDLNNLATREIVKKFEPGELESARNVEDSWAKQNGIQYFNFPINSLGPMSLKENQAVNEILKIMTDPQSTPVFVHCEHGRDRTGMIVSLYRVKTTSVTVHQAHEEWESYGHEEINMMFTSDLDSYFYKKALWLRFLRWTGISH